MTLAELPRPDARAWQSLLADDSLPTLAQEAAAVRPVPDSFCYAVTCDRPPIDVELPEMTLSADVRSLLERDSGPPDGRSRRADTGAPTAASPWRATTAWKGRVP